MCCQADEVHGYNSHVEPQATGFLRLSQEARRRPQLRSSAFHCVPLRSIAFNSVQLRSIAFNCVPLRSIAFNSVQLRSIAFHCVRLCSIAFNSVQLRSIAFNSVPLRSIAYTFGASVSFRPVTHNVPAGDLPRLRKAHLDRGEQAVFRKTRR